ncbi:MAG: Maf family protein [Proteobacteria bacterium]|nr:Maf family protein [Pseudomonadota bacterium]
MLPENITSSRRPEIMLASTSPYRAQLLRRLRFPFRQMAPRFVETPQPGEAPQQMALRLAEGKARSLVTEVSRPGIVIGSDQVAHCDGRVLGKPGNYEQATLQLSHSSGKWVTFSTGVALLGSDGRQACACEDYRIRFRQLTPKEIERYLTLEQPFDCAGSLKAEGLGISLLEDATGRDITTLYGLPLMLLRELFLKLDIDPNQLIPSQ